jgi:hypothetical protein
MKCHRYWVVIPAALIVQAALSAQSLADVAKTEEARRKSIKTATKVYTNDDLGGTPEVSSAPAPQAGGSAPEKPADGDQKPAEKKPDPAKTQAHWTERATTIQQSLSRNKLLLEALQSQVNGLNAEFVNMDDPGQRALLQTRLQRATGELQRVQQDIDKQTKAAADLQEEARKAGVPAGWVR